MASPLRWFRKHSFFFIVVFGVFLMAIFGLGSVISGLNPSSMGRSAQVENSTVASWSGGQLDQMDVASLRTRHFASLRFLTNVYKYSVEKNGGNSFPVAVEEILPIANRNENPSVEEMDDRILNRYLFAKRAEQEGFVVDDKMVYEYVAQYGGDTILTKEILKQLNRQVNQQLPLTAVVRHLQVELLWQQMESMTDGGLAFDPGVAPQSPRRLSSLTAIAPTEAVQLYKKSSKKIECVVLPLSIEEYVSKISDEPSASELKALYEEGKYDYPVYSFDTPGFKQLKKAKVQYFKAEMKTFLDNEIAKLTDEEIQAEYDRLVEAEDKSVMQVVPLEEEKKDEDSTSEEQQPGNDDPAPAPGEAMKSDSSENEDASPAEPAEPTESSTETPDDDGPAVEESATEESEGGYTSVRFQDEDEATNEAVQETESETVTEPAENAEEAVAESDPVTPLEEAPAEEPATDTEASDLTTDDTQQDPVIEDEPKTKLVAKPLTEVVDQIKRQMKIQDANKARDTALAAAEKAVTFYQRDLSTYEMKVAAGKKDFEKPEVPDFKALADELGIQFFETELIDQTQIGDEDIGKVVDISIGPGGRAMQVNIGQQIFQEFDNLPEYQVLAANDFVKSEKYMYWLAEKVDQRVPTLDEAKESIVKYWKHNKAVDMATEEANKIAAQINGSAGTLLNEMKPENAKLTGQFSWFSSFGRFDYGAPEGVKNPSENFMSVAFGLDKQKAEVAINETRDEVYVVQNITPDDSEDVDFDNEYLEKKFFLTKQVPREVVSAKARYRQLMIEDWIKDFRKTMDIKIMGQ